MRVRPLIAAIWLAMSIQPCVSSADPAPAAGEARTFATLRDVAQKAIETNPEVSVRWHNFRAAVEEVDVARGGFFPRVDLTAGTGREKIDQFTNRLNTSAETDFNRHGWLFSVNQMLFDGFATRNEVKRLGKAQLVRYYELLDASSAVALESARAYLDVLRFRFLVDLAEDNYVQHKATFEQLLRRTQSGVGRRVDLEQAASRLALAEVNLTTEIANLHDVTARYQRIVNTMPPQVAYSPALISRAFPTTQKGALERALSSNPTLLAANENIAAADYDIAVRRAAYLPRFDLRGRADNTSNYQGIGERSSSAAEVVMTYNLFNGGSDRARERQYAERRNAAIDLRDKACRDNRQTLAIAYNDVIRLRDQVSFLNIQVGLLEKTRDAYRDQFNVGQRTLLDLLDTENELLSARRSAINADMDLSVAYLRTYAGMGTLLEFLELKRADVDPPDPDDLAQVGAGELCGAEPIRVAPIDREALNARALALLESNRISMSPEGVAAAADGASSPTAAAEANATLAVRRWAALIARKDYDGVRSLYAPGFVPPGGVDRDAWFAERKKRLATPGQLPVDITDLSVRLEGVDRAVARFTQDYDDDLKPGRTSRTLELVKVGNAWLISRQTSVPAGRK